MMVKFSGYFLFLPFALEVNITDAELFFILFIPFLICTFYKVVLGLIFRKANESFLGAFVPICNL